MTAALTEKKLVTADEFFEMDLPAGRAELIDGEVFTMAPAGGEHGETTYEIGRLLGNHVKANELGRMAAAETGFRISQNPDVVRAPDVAFVSRTRNGGAKLPRGFCPFAPDLAVEVASPNDRPDEIASKTREWLRAGTQQVWMVYPGARQVHRFRADGSAQVLQESDSLDGETVVPGFNCSVAELFE